MDIKRIIEKGKPFVFLWNEKDQKEGRIYAVDESRGFQTGYIHKIFFYMVMYNKEGLPVMHSPITRDPRKHGLFDWWKQNEITHKITDLKLYEEWLKR